MMSDDDQAAIYGSLRASTAKLLGYDDVGRLSAAQEIRLSRAISLRLICDAAQAAQLCGRPYDVRAFTDASEALERMVGGNPDAPSQQRFSGEHQKRLRELIEKTVLAPSFDEDEREAELMWREEYAAFLAAGGNADSWKPAPASGNGLAVVAPSAADGDASGGGVLPPSPSRAPDHPPPRAETDAEWHARVNARAAENVARSGYLKREEPWMDVWRASPWSNL